MLVNHPKRLAIGLFLIVLCTSNTYAQKKMEYGISLAFNYSDLHLKNNLAPSLMIEDIYKPAMGFGVGIRAGYKLSDDLKVTINPGFNWLASSGNTEQSANSQLQGVYFNMPLLLHYEFVDNFSFNAGMAYDYLVNLTAQNGDESLDRTSIADNRSLFSAQAGFSYAIGDLVELGLSYNHGLSTLTSFFFTDFNGNAIGNSKMTNRYAQFKITFRA